jgi:hypothetical protein
MRSKITDSAVFPSVACAPREPWNKGNLIGQKAPLYQVIKSLRVACCGDESIAGFEYGLRNVSAQTARTAGD